MAFFGCATTIPPLDKGAYATTTPPDLRRYNSAVEIVGVRSLTDSQFIVLDFRITADATHSPALIWDEIVLPNLFDHNGIGLCARLPNDESEIVLSAVDPPMFATSYHSSFTEYFTEDPAGKCRIYSVPVRTNRKLSPGAAVQIHLKPLPIERAAQSESITIEALAQSSILIIAR